MCWSPKDKFNSTLIHYKSLEFKLGSLADYSMCGSKVNNGVRRSYVSINFENSVP